MATSQRIDLRVKLSCLNVNLCELSYSSCRRRAKAKHSYLENTDILRVVVVKLMQLSDLRIRRYLIENFNFDETNDNKQDDESTPSLSFNHGLPTEKLFICSNERICLLGV